MGVDASKVFAYYESPFVEKYGATGCAQAAMATILSYYGLEPFDPGLAERLFLDPATRPDIVNGAFGTSWERVRDVLRSRGLNVEAGNVAILETASDSDIDQMIANLAAWTTQGIPVCAIVGNGEIDGGQGAHWGVVVSASPTRVILANFPTGSDPIQHLPAGHLVLTSDVFRNAWKARWLPGVHYAFVAARPA